MKRGFTLIELLIYLALVSVVVTSLILWVLNLSGVRNKNFAAVEVAANSQFVISEITREIKQAEAIVAPAAGAAGATLELDRPGALPNAVFRAVAGALYFEVVGNPPVAVSSSLVEVADLVFRNLTGAFDDRANVAVQAVVRFRDSASGDFAYEREINTAVSNRL
ncbi:MAG: type II secretion system protein [Candidatus Vogelbacteria bacterium]|nr:type II secretion system protein [Candidatus Vogelbacteria bacterium]